MSLSETSKKISVVCGVQEKECNTTVSQVQNCTVPSTDLFAIFSHSQFQLRNQFHPKRPLLDPGYKVCFISYYYMALNYKDWKLLN